VLVATSHGVHIITAPSSSQHTRGQSCGIWSSISSRPIIRDFRNHDATRENSPCNSVWLPLPHSFPSFSGLESRNRLSPAFPFSLFSSPFQCRPPSWRDVATIMATRCTFSLRQRRTRWRSIVGLQVKSSDFSLVDLSRDPFRFGSKSIWTLTSAYAFFSRRSLMIRYCSLVIVFRRPSSISSRQFPSNHQNTDVLILTHRVLSQNRVVRTISDLPWQHPLLGPGTDLSEAAGAWRREMPLSPLVHTV